LVFFGGFSARDDRHKPYHLIANLKRDDVYVAIDDDEKKLLARILGLVRVVSNTPEVSATKMHDNRLERNLPSGLEKIILCGIPVILHHQRMPDGHTPRK
jgi:hypothetical protein